MTDPLREAIEGAVRDITKVPHSKSRTTAIIAALLDRATVEARKDAYRYARAAVIASPVSISGQHIGNLPGGMPHVMDRQVGTVGPNELPKYATTYAMRDFILAKLDEQVASLKAGTPGKESK